MAKLEKGGCGGICRGEGSEDGSGGEGGGGTGCCDVEFGILSSSACVLIEGDGFAGTGVMVDATLATYPSINCRTLAGFTSSTISHLGRTSTSVSPFSLPSNPSPPPSSSS